MNSGSEVLEDDAVAVAEAPQASDAELQELRAAVPASLWKAVQFNDVDVQTAHLKSYLEGTQGHTWRNDESEQIPVPKKTAPEKVIHEKPLIPLGMVKVDDVRTKVTAVLTGLITAHPHKEDQILQEFMRIDDQILQMTARNNKELMSSAAAKSVETNVGKIRAKFVENEEQKNGKKGKRGGMRVRNDDDDLEGRYDVSFR